MVGPAVSVIVPVYNGGVYLSACIDSILGQSFSDFELIVVDDASTDETGEMLEHYCQVDSRVQVMRHDKTMGAGCARNSGLQKACGRYLLFLDADDVYDVKLLESVASTSEQYDVDVVLFGADDFLNDSMPVPNQYYIDRRFLPDTKVFNREDVPQRLFQICTPEPWIKAFRRSFVNQIGVEFQALPNSNDLFFTLASLASAKRVVVLDEVLVHHRVGNASSIQGTKRRNSGAFLEALRALGDYLRQNGWYDQLRVSYANLVLFHCLYNRDAKVDWRRVFDEFGLFSLAKDSFVSPDDYRDFIHLTIQDLSEQDALESNQSAVWIRAVVQLSAELEEQKAETSRAWLEVQNVQDSMTFKIGKCLTAPIRFILGKLGGSSG